MERGELPTGDYFDRLDDLSRQLDIYSSAEERSLEEVSGGTQETAQRFFDTAANLEESLTDSLAERDPEAADALLAMIGIDFDIAERAANLVWLVGESLANQEWPMRPERREPWAPR